MRGIVDATRAASRVPTDVVGKVRRACERTVLGGVQALRAAAVHGYRHLVAELALNRPQSAWTSEGVLSALGALAGHHCDAPVGAHAAPRRTATWCGWQTAHSLTAACFARR